MTNKIQPRSENKTGEKIPLFTSVQTTTCVRYPGRIDNSPPMRKLHVALPSTASRRPHTLSVRARRRSRHNSRIFTRGEKAQKFHGGSNVYFLQKFNPLCTTQTVFCNLVLTRQTKPKLTFRWVKIGFVCEGGQGERGAVSHLVLPDVQQSDSFASLSPAERSLRV